MRLASTLRDFDPGQLRQHSYRVEGRGATQAGESVVIPDLNAPTTKAVLQVFRGQARLSDMAPSATTIAATTIAPAAPATTAAPPTSVPVVEVAPNPLGISPPDDPTCR